MAFESIKIAPKRGSSAGITASIVGPNQVRILINPDIAFRFGWVLGTKLERLVGTGADKNKLLLKTADRDTKNPVRLGLPNKSSRRLMISAPAVSLGLPRESDKKTVNCPYEITVSGLLIDYSQFATDVTAAQAAE